MSFYFVIQSGPLKGAHYKVSPNITLGRDSSNDILIKDPHVSSLHAQVLQKKEGLYLINKSVKNKIRTNGQKTESLLLKEGLLFQLGKTEIQVERATNDTPAPVEQKTWGQLLYDNLSEKNFTNAAVAKSITALTPMVRLTFITGLQRKTQWLLGYGPRHIGPSSYDLPIVGDNIPDLCFSIVQKNKVPFFQTNHPDKVLFNKQSVSTAALQDRDIIYIDKIKIEIHLL
ncbi:MAG: FHA domain-containing protein [Bdellovibrionaceae bacterium]|nr:FHA domain-containing protein [Pseudobdellovibrionaceae bacterium]